MNEETINKIKHWLKLENELKLLALEVRKRKLEKKQLTEEVMSVMKMNELDCIDTSGGKILYKKSETKKPLNKKSLELILKKYCENQDEKAEEICNFILDNRETKVNESIKLKQNKT
tara:strand:- start:2100 stop:2450 length:351 start_codon:yes stop_codon:yes gene_type:complete